MENNWKNRKVCSVIPMQIDIKKGIKLLGHVNLKKKETKRQI